MTLVHDEQMCQVTLHPEGNGSVLIQPIPGVEGGLTQFDLTPEEVAELGGFMAGNSLATSLRASLSKKVGLS